MERFGFDVQIARMAEKNLLYEVIKAFARCDLSEDRVDSLQMGYVFEELIRLGAEQSNEEAGEHFTPREVIKLMVNLLLAPEQDLRRNHVVKTIYDPACGTGGMLSVAEKYIRELNAEANPLLFGQDWNDEAWAVCRADMLINGEDAENIKLGDADAVSPQPNTTRKGSPVCPGLPQRSRGDLRRLQTVVRHYDRTSIQEVSDPLMLVRLKYELDETQIYHWCEVEAFARVFYKPVERQSPADHAQLQRHLQPAVDRFNATEDEDQRKAFRDRLSAFVRVYAYLSQIIPYADANLDRLYSYGSASAPAPGARQRPRGPGERRTTGVLPIGTHRVRRYQDPGRGATSG